MKKVELIIKYILILLWSGSCTSEETAVDLSETVQYKTENVILVVIDGIYRVYPLQGSRKISFFLYNDLLLRRITDRWRSAIWDSKDRSYNNYRYKSTELLVQNHVGYGFHLLVARRIIIQKAVGAGIFYSLTDGDELTSGAPEIGDNNSNGYGPVGFSWQVKLGFGFLLL